MSDKLEDRDALKRMLHLFNDTRERKKKESAFLRLFIRTTILYYTIEKWTEFGYCLGDFSKTMKWQQKKKTGSLQQSLT